MSSWGKYDNAANAPLWAVNSTILKNNPTKAAPTRANVTLLYANTSPNVYVQNETVGVFGVDAQESLATHAQHTGWVLRTVGQGGRAGRVFNEVLVALSSLNGSDGDGQTYANVKITLSGPTNGTVLASGSYANTVTFTVTPTLVGNTAAALTYAWQTNNATGTRGWTTPTDIANIHFTGVTTASLGVKPANTANTTDVFRVVVTAANQGVVATSGNATITIA